MNHCLNEFLQPASKDKVVFAIISMLFLIETKQTVTQFLSPPLPPSLSS